MSTTQGKIRIAIAGAGPAGLALAAGFAKQSIDFHIYESVSDYKDVGAGLGLQKNAVAALSLIGPEVRQAFIDKASRVDEASDAVAIRIILAEGPHCGKRVGSLQSPEGTIARADLLQALLQLTPKNRITFGKRLERIDEDENGVILTFTDGSAARADCLIGADGVHSVTRRHILGPHHPAAEPKNHDKWQIYRATTTMEQAGQLVGFEGWNRTVSIMLGPNGHINSVPLRQGDVGCLSAGVAVRGAALAEGEPVITPSLYQNYGADAQALVRLVAERAPVSWAPSDHDHAPSYFRGRACIIGDAAHAALPFAANGAGQAFEDCAVLAAVFSKVSEPAQIASALAAYDTVRRPRSQAFVDLARKFGRVFAYAESSMRDDPEKMRDFFASVAFHTNSFDLRAQNDEAIRLFEKREISI